MRLGFRTQLALAFIIVIILPIVVVIISLQISMSRVLHEPNVQELRRLATWYERIMQQVVSSYDNIDDYDEFNDRISTLLTKYEGRIRIIDYSGALLFDSMDKEASLERKSLAEEYNGGFKLKFQNRPSGFYSFQESVIIDSAPVAIAEITLNMNLVGQGIFYKMISYVILSLGLGLFFLIVLIFLLSWTISRGILIPLKELNAATENIAHGNLSFQINYKRRNELGKFCAAFETMRLKLLESLEKQVAEEKARKELIASISHDLRTPIASIRGYVEGLQDGIVHDKEKFQRYLSIIKDKSEKLDRLIDDFFQYSQLEVGRLNMEFQEWDGAKLLEEIFSSIELEFNKGGTGIIIERPFPSCRIMVDYHRIVQVADNIIQNAKRYIPSNGNIRIRALIEKDALQVSIKDNGIGISKEDLPYIFNRFYRGEKSRSRDYGGTGLGLAICKEIIIAHGGQIWAESKEGSGTIMYFSIPLITKQLKFAEESYGFH